MLAGVLFTNGLVEEDLGHKTQDTRHKTQVRIQEPEVKIIAFSGFLVIKKANNTNYYLLFLITNGMLSKQILLGGKVLIGRYREVFTNGMLER